MPWQDRVPAGRKPRWVLMPDRASAVLLLHIHPARMHSLFLENGRMKEGYIVYGTIVAVGSIIAGGCFAEAGMFAIAVCFWIVTLGATVTACVLATESGR